MADKYDVSNFATISGSFPLDALSDIQGILKEHGDMYFVTRATDTEDSMGHVTASANTPLRIYGMFQDITKKDRKIHDMGLAVPGNRKFYFMPSYSTQTGGVKTTYELKEGDYITDARQYTGAGNTGQFRLIKIFKQWQEPGVEIYRTGIVQSMDLDGTE